jgi:protein-S-isoprenylcysteine O-methyltransferase Ste14
MEEVSKTKVYESYLLVGLQFFLILLIGMATQPVPKTVDEVLLYLVFVAVGMWAVFATREIISIFPEPRKNTFLVVTGPYQLIRHPMYLAVLGITAVWIYSFMKTALASDMLFPIILWLFLLVVLFAKMEREEAYLQEMFPTYEEYQRMTWRLIPFIY